MTDEQIRLMGTLVLIRMDISLIVEEHASMHYCLSDFVHFSVQGQDFTGRRGHWQQVVPAGTRAMGQFNRFSDPDVHG